MIIDLGAGAPVQPIIQFTVGGTEYKYTGQEINVANKFRIVSDGLTGWKLWVYDNLSFQFSFINTPVDVCAIGHGAKGNNPWIRYDEDKYDAGSGGNGGQILNLLNQSFAIGDTIGITIGDSTTVTKNGTAFASPTNGGGASGGAGAAEGPDSAYRRGSAPGTNGSYAFDSTDSSFDGIKYAPGGGGGGTWSFPGDSPGSDAGSPGFGGQGNGGQGGKGIVLMRYKP